VKTIFSTRDLHPRDRFDFWYSVACRNLAQHDATPASRQTFQAELRMGSLADVELCLFIRSAMAFSHTSRHAALAGTDDLFVCRQLGGRLELEQEGRQAVLESGDFALLDPTRAYWGRVVGDSSLLLLKVPRRAMESRVGRVRDVTACAATSARGEQSIAASMLALLPEQASGLGAVGRDMVREQLLDLVALCLRGSAAKGGAQATSAQALVLARIRAVVGVFSPPEPPGD
jgi:hypothetical protein